MGGHRDGLARPLRGLPESIIERLRVGAGEIASRTAGMAGSLASGTFIALLGLFFALLAMHAVLRHWPRIVSALVVVSLCATNTPDCSSTSSGGWDA